MLNPKSKENLWYLQEILLRKNQTENVESFNAESEQREWGREEVRLLQIFQFRQQSVDSVAMTCGLFIL